MCVCVCLCYNVNKRKKNSLEICEAIAVNDFEYDGFRRRSIERDEFLANLPTLFTRRQRIQYQCIRSHRSKSKQAAAGRANFRFVSSAGEWATAGGHSILLHYMLQNTKLITKKKKQHFQFQITKFDALPSNICHACLFTTELFSDFRDKVQKCEQKLQKFVVSLCANNEMPPSFVMGGAIDVPDDGHFADNRQIVIIDPTKCYASSDDENDADEETKQSSDLTVDPAAIVNGKSDSKLFNAEMPEGFRNIYFCQYCETAFVSQQECEVHETHNHDPQLPHICNFCSYRAADRNTIIAHIKQSHESDKPFVCVQCHKQFGRRSDLKKHAICHTGIRPFACNVCPKSFSRNSNLQKHIKSHQGVKPFACQSCSRSFTSTTDLQRHESMHQQTIRPFRCEKCPKTFARRDALQQHKTKHDPPKSKDTENMVISLNPFNEITKYPLLSSALGIPLAPLPSTQSPAMFAMPEHIHENVVVYPHLVTGDAYTFVTPNNPKKAKDTPVKTIACDKCPKKFSKMSSLHNHMNVHLNTGTSHECQPCQKIFKTKRELQRHNLIHNGVKKFQCNTCGKRFLRRDKLVRHENVHKSKKLAALPESAFLPENLIKHDSFYSPTERRAQHINASTNSEQQRLQLLEQQTLRPQFYAEYDLTETNKS